MRSRTLSLTIALLVAGTSSLASAATLTIGTGTSANVFPFGGTSLANPTTYQQVYDGTLFGGSPTTINSISFELVSGTVSAGNYSLSISTTNKAVNGLDTTNFANNIGGDNTLFYSGTLAGQLSGNILAFSVPGFLYDPGMGNVIINVSVSSVEGVSGSFRANNGDANGAFSRAHDFGSATSNWGLVTTFDIGDPVPEPETWALMIVGLGLAGAAMRRARPTVAHA